MPRLSLTIPLALISLVATATPAVACRSAEDPAPKPAVLAKHQKAVPQLEVTKRVTGLSSPWDVKSLGNGQLLITERDTARLYMRRQGRQAPRGLPERQGVGLRRDRPDVAGGRSRTSTRNRRFYTCSGWKVGTGHDIRVIAWRLSRGRPRRRTGCGPLLGGFPTSSGRHGGCRLLIARDGSLYVGTGDAAIGTNPQRPRLARRQDAAAQPPHRRTVAEQPVHRRRGRAAPLRGHVRPPQRAGLGPARRRERVVGRARLLPRRRGQPARARR